MRIASFLQIIAILDHYMADKMLAFDRNCCFERTQQFKEINLKEISYQTMEKRLTFYSVFATEMSANIPE